MGLPNYLKDIENMVAIFNIYILELIRVVQGQEMYDIYYRWLNDTESSDLIKGTILGLLRLEVNDEFAEMEIAVKHNNVKDLLFGWVYGIMPFNQQLAENTDMLDFLETNGVEETLSDIIFDYVEKWKEN